ncbi:MAG: PQQ-binding-like beta-propeller repeat protein [Pirellulales bacterium]
MRLIRSRYCPSMLVVLGTLVLPQLGCSQADPAAAAGGSAKAAPLAAADAKQDQQRAGQKARQGASAQAAKKRTDARAQAGRRSAVAQADAQPNKEWNQWAGSPARNNTPVGQNIPTDWEPGDFDFDTGEWQPETSRNIKWVAKLGSQSYGNPVIADGKTFVGTNNGAGWLDRYPPDVDLGCLLAFNEADGKFLWQHSSEKLPTGRVHDWPLQGICSTPLVEGKRLWFVTSRGEVVCLDAEGFHDGENNGPYQSETNNNTDEADAIWYFDMMSELQVSQHNMASCSITAAGDILFVCTSNGVDEAHSENLPSPNAPSFLAMDKNTGRVLWHDNSPGTNVLHGQWSSPAYAVLGGVPQVLFAGGDGWLYSFRGEATSDGKPELLWKFDCNPKESKYTISSSGTRNNLISTPVVYDGLVYIAVGEDPEHGEGNGHLWCIDPTKRGDVSSELAFNVDDRTTPIPHRRLQAVIPQQGEIAVSNPNSAAVWHYTEYDWNGDGEIEEFEEKMHRTCGTVAIKDDLLFIPDFSGLFHCLDAKTGEVHWTYDLYAATWGSAMIVEDKVYVGDEEGEVSIFRLSADPDVAMQKDDKGKYQPIAQVEMGNAVYSTPVVANNVLYIANKTHLFAIQETDDRVEADGSRHGESAEQP